MFEKQAVIITEAEKPSREGVLSLQIKSVINATAFINKNQSGNKP